MILLDTIEEKRVKAANIFWLLALPSDKFLQKKLQKNILRAIQEINRDRDSRVRFRESLKNITSNYNAD